MPPEFDHTNWDESEYLNWFNRKDRSHWDEMADMAERDSVFSHYEIGFLRSIARQAGSRANPPSLKQLKKTKYLSDLIDDKTSQARSRRNTPTNLANEPKHLTVRMAWHDNKWDGTICADPQNNEYCIGEYSLLSRRIRHQRKTEQEQLHHGEVPDPKKLDGYQPPCFWSMNAFGKQALKVSHGNPAAPDLEAIPDDLPPYSVFTWPFKLSFMRDQYEIEREGKYPPNLEYRIDNFLSKFKRNESIVFFYTNYDNPVSGEERKYLVVGCGFLSDVGPKKQFDIPPPRLQQLRSRWQSQNFPEINWAIRFTVDSPDRTVVLPYHEYLKDAETKDDYSYLDEIKVVISEPELTSCFKYVAMDIDDDQAIYLLTKIRKSLLTIVKQGKRLEFDAEAALLKIEIMLRFVWTKRGYFPGFNNLVDIALDREDGRMVRLHDMLGDLKKAFNEEYAKKLIAFMENPDQLTRDFRTFKSEVEEIIDECNGKELSPLDFLRLAMLNLNKNQFKNIWNNALGDDDLSAKSVAANLYSLFEKYNDHVEFKEDKNTGEDVDALIPLFKIDIALFPDGRFLPKLRDIQDVQPSDKRRVRALVIEYLSSIQDRGDCFDFSENIEESLRDYPLFYKTEYGLPLGVLKNPNDDVRMHVAKKLVLETKDGRSFVYLKRVRQAEEYVDEVIRLLANLTDLPQSPHLKFDDYIKSSSDKLSTILGKNFDREEFVAERRNLYQNITAKRLFLLSGAPGTGKSHELLKFLSSLSANGEEYLLLAPTGKASLRLSSDETAKDIKAQTIDKFLWDLGDKKPVRTLRVENLVIDEMSMVDLLKLDDLLRVFDFEGPHFKRLILVGDPSQLPPIGCGKPFLDIIRFLKAGQEKYAKNSVFLEVNCRQRLDPDILDFARIFSGENKNYENLFGRVASAGELSKGLFVSHWEDSTELRSQIAARLKSLYGNAEASDFDLILNRTFNLNDDGSIKDKADFRAQLKIDNWQIITPYRTTYYGSIGVNNFVQQTLRAKTPVKEKGDALFKQGDKVIQVENHYKWINKKKKLVLANGSIGVFSCNRNNQVFFPETEDPIAWSEIKDESIELGYAITVHKAQGSGFDHVFLILPRRKALLSRELLYTALTRSRAGISVFIQSAGQGTEVISFLDEVRRTSHVATRKTTLLDSPVWEYSYSPERGVVVKSRVEYIIYKKLQEAKQKYSGFDFVYEQKLDVGRKEFDIHPDFTIVLPSGKTYYWEHLGMWGRRSYERDWSERMELYREKGLLENLITTDEIHGIRDVKLEKVVDAILGGDPVGEVQSSNFSKRHYTLA